MNRTGLIFCRKALPWFGALVIVTLLFSILANAQEPDRDDPPGRVARLGHMDGSISFQPAGESEWVEAVRNRPMTTGDKLWSDRDSRAEVQLGSSTIDLAPNTGFSFLNLDDRTVQVQLSAGTINVRVYELDRDDVYEIDTPNQAFTISRPGRYRLESSENGDYTVVTVREGEGEAAGNGQTYTIHTGQRVTLRGTNSLNADFEQIGEPDHFDRWSYDRERRFEDSPSARYCSRQMVGFDDLDDNGDWRPAPEYGYVWYPHVEVGWAPYHNGHWAWIDPWGWTWVDDAHWGYAPFHYGRWVSIRGRWGWIPGPREVHPVYAPALVAFVGGVGVGVGGNVAWFPLGPREVYVPSYHVSRGYVNRVNVTNTTVNVTQVTNVYNTTIINNNTTINNVTYVNRNVHGAVTAVPQHAFATAQPVARTAVVVNQAQLSRVSVTTRAAVAPAPQAVLGVRAETVSHVAAPPAAVMNRQVIAKTAPPPPPPSFAARQQALTEHPGVPLARPQLQQMRTANPPASVPRVITAPSARPMPSAGGNQPMNQANPRPGNMGNQPAPGGNERPSMNTPPPIHPQPGNPPAGEFNQPNNRPAPNPPVNRPEPGATRPFGPPPRTDRPAPAQPNNPPSDPSSNRPMPNQPAPNNRPENSRPFEPPARNDRPATAPPNQPMPNNEIKRPSEPPVRNDRPVTMQPPPRPEPRPERTQPQMNQAQPSRPQPRNEPAPRPQTPPPAERPQVRPPVQNKPAPPPAQHEPNKPQKQDEKHKPQ